MRFEARLWSSGEHFVSTDGYFAPQFMVVKSSSAIDGPAANFSYVMKANRPNLFTMRAIIKK